MDIIREIEILEYKIIEIDKKLVAFKKYDLSEIKISQMEAMKENYQRQLSEYKSKL